jgi:ferredoxin
MGHIVNPDREYRLLQQRLGRNVTGAPESAVLIKILRLLFSPDEAELASSLDSLSHKLGIPPDLLGDKLTGMAQRGVLVDFEHRGQHYFVLPPVVIGFFEFTFMRAREDLPMTELARLFDEYMSESDRFPRSVFRGQTQIGRSLVREEALPEMDHTEILDWERASRIVQTASATGLSLCACRHKASHLGKACDRALRSCLSLNYAAKTMIRNGLAEPITTEEAMRILGASKEAGLAQTGDNVRHNVAYICNCCKCCCGMLQAVKTFGIRNAVVTSNWIMEVDLSRCKGCGSCAKVCPVEAIEIIQEAVGNKNRQWAVLNEALCLGCGVCYSACKFGGITMKPRARKVFTPETIFDQTVSMAIERGKLADLIFNEPEKLSHRALGRIVGILEKSSPFKAAMAIAPLRSVFLKAAVAGAKRRLGEFAEVLE